MQFVNRRRFASVHKFLLFCNILEAGPSTRMTWKSAGNKHDDPFFYQAFFRTKLP